MYGGHITDFFDRRTNNTYLSVIFNESLLRKGELAPKLVSPDCIQWDYGNPYPFPNKTSTTITYSLHTCSGLFLSGLYANLIAKSLPPESPTIYGLHPNAEIGFLTNKAENIFQTILRLSVGSESSPTPAGNKESAKDSGSFLNTGIVEYNLIRMAMLLAYIDDSSVASAPGAAPTASSGASLLRETLAVLTKRCPTPFNMIDLSDRSMQVGV
jgi:hypothetical protein